jgi:hypothetical protein
VDARSRTTQAGMKCLIGIPRNTYYHPTHLSIGEFGADVAAK